MRKWALLLPLAACAAEPSQDAVNRSAERVAAQVVGLTFPDLRSRDQGATCIRQSGTPEEVLTLASFEGRDLRGGGGALALDILDRPNTKTCLAGQGISLS